MIVRDRLFIREVTQLISGRGGLFHLENTIGRLLKKPPPPLQGLDIS